MKILKYGWLCLIYDYRDDRKVHVQTVAYISNGLHAIIIYLISTSNANHALALIC